MQSRTKLFIAALVVLACAAITPVSAYSISVTTGSGDPLISSQLQSMISGMQITSGQSGAFSYLSVDAADLGIQGSTGSVQAYSSSRIQNQNQLVKFSESVSVYGIIQEFHYSAHFESGVNR